MKGGCSHGLVAVRSKEWEAAGNEGIIASTLL